MKNIIISISLFVLVLFSGCSSKYPITYDSTPSGASVVCNGINHGYAPITLYYEPDENSKKNGSMKTISCTANWASGATASYGNTWDLNKFPNGVRQTLPRPNIDGYDKDAQFALQVQQMKYQKQQVDAAETQNFNQSMQNLNQNLQMQQQNMQLQQLNNNLFMRRMGY